MLSIVHLSLRQISRCPRAARRCPYSLAVFRSNAIFFPTAIVIIYLIAIDISIWQTGEVNLRHTPVTLTALPAYQCTGSKKTAGALIDAISLATSTMVGASLVDATELPHAILAALLHQTPPTEFAMLADTSSRRLGGSTSISAYRKLPVSRHPAMREQSADTAVR